MMIKLAILLSSLLLASPSPDRLGTFFSIEQNPGKGKLFYGEGSKKLASIELGKKSGFYGLGMIFPGKSLPGNLGKDFEKTQILQVAFGSVMPPKDGSIPQFASVTMLSPSIPKKKTVFSLSLPNSQDLKKQNTALLLFTPPGLKLTEADDEKLKKTFFASHGTITLTPMGSAFTATLTDNGKTSLFFKQWMRADFQAELSTPFVKNPEKLTGQTEFLFYWPKDAAALSQMAEIASESLRAVGAVPQKR